MVRARLLILVLVAAVAACGGGDGSSLPTVEGGDSPDALTEGRLVLDGDCVVLEQTLAGQEARVLTVWPEGAELEREPAPHVAVPGGPDVPLDGEVRGVAGGFLAESSAAAVAEIGSDALDGCAARLDLRSAWLVSGVQARPRSG